MRLPNANKAFVDDAKLVQYCLNPDHPRGKHKARRFAAAGITEASAAILKTALLDAAGTEEAQVGETGVHGARYSIDFNLVTARGIFRVRSAWLVRRTEDFRRLVTCFIVSA
jgi:hypothetical protein